MDKFIHGSRLRLNKKQSNETLQANSPKLGDCASGLGFRSSMEVILNMNKEMEEPKPK